MKKKIIALTVALLLPGSTLPALATGIPTVDLASVAQTVAEGLTRAAEAKAAMDQAKQQFQQAKDFADETKRRFESFTDFKTGFDTAAAYLNDLNKLNDTINNDSINISGQYKKYKIDKNSYSDSILKEITVYENFYEELTKRSKDLDKLRAKFSTAKTPAQKSDLTNQLLFAMLQLNTELKSYDIQLQRLEKINTIRVMEAQKKWDDKYEWRG